MLKFSVVERQGLNNSCHHYSCGTVGRRLNRPGMFYCGFPFEGMNADEDVMHQWHTEHGAEYLMEDKLHRLTVCFRQMGSQSCLSMEVEEMT